MLALAQSRRNRLEWSGPSQLDDKSWDFKELGRKRCRKPVQFVEHNRREEIDRALVDGESFRNIAQRTGTSTTALHRHKTQHIPKSLALARETAEEVQAGTLFDRLRFVGRVTQEILREARGAKNHIIALQAIGRIERQLELEARLLGELDDSAKVAAGVQVSRLPDVSHLTDEQLFVEQRILREARERLEANRAGRPRPADDRGCGGIG